MKKLQLLIPVIAFTGLIAFLTHTSMKTPAGADSGGCDAGTSQQAARGKEAPCYIILSVDLGADGEIAMGETGHATVELKCNGSKQVGKCEVELKLKDGAKMKGGAQTVKLGCNTKPKTISFSPTNVPANNKAKLAAVPQKECECAGAKKEIKIVGGGGGGDDCKLTVSADSSNLCFGESTDITVELERENDRETKKPCKIRISSPNRVDFNGTKNKSDDMVKIAGSGSKTISATPDEVGTITIQVKSTCCGEESLDINVDPVITKFTAVGFPKCKRCGVSRDDFVIRTNPSGYKDKVQVNIPSQQSGTHTATATLCNTKEAEYTLKGPEADWFKFEGFPLGSAGDAIDEMDDKIWLQNVGRTRLTISKTWRKGKFKASGSWEWKKLGRGIRPPGGTFTTSKSFSTAESVSVGGSLSYSYSGFTGSLSLNLGVTFENTTSHSLTSGPDQCDCGRSCEFRYTHYQSVVDITTNNKVWEKTQSTAKRGPNRDPDKLDKPSSDEFDNLIENTSSTLPTMGKSLYNSTTEKRCKD